MGIELGSKPLNLEPLRARLREKPRTKIGQVKQAWPYIKELLAAGHTLKDIWKWLDDVGIQIGYGRLSDYVGQLRRRDEGSRGGVAPITPMPVPRANEAADSRQSIPHGDPLANIVERERNRPGFHYNPEPDPKKLI